MKAGFFPMLAVSGMRKNRQLYTPYLLACTGIVCVSYIVAFLGVSPVIRAMRGGTSTTMILQLGKGAGRQAGRRGLGACAQQVVQLGRVGVKRKQLLCILARRANGVRQPEPGQCFVHGGCPLLSSRLHSGGQRTARPTPAAAP